MSNKLIYSCLFLFSFAALFYSVKAAKGVCTRTRARTTYYSKYGTRIYYYTETYKTCCSQFIWCWKKCTRSRTRSSYEGYYYRASRTSYYKQSYCCSGYSGTPNNCKPICSGGCGHGSCVSPGKCSCQTGWTGSKCNIDVNECSSSNGGCGQKCNNNAGSYTCSCYSGYRLNSNKRSCSDINECSSNNGGCEHQCKNQVGSYYCKCNSGYSLLSNQHSCSDINECSSNKGGCEQNCHNTVGSFYCSCNTGFVLLDNQKDCSDHNECASNNGGCAHQCHNTHGAHYCTCNTGYALQGTTSCVDINECNSNNGGCGQSCTNQVGSYQCSCTSGYMLDSNKHNCTDINECSNNNGGCDHTCKNTVGGHDCSCNSGYQLQSNDRTCEDINECSKSNGGCDHSCHNTAGSFYCTCNNGYLLLEDKTGCTDHDECASNNGGCDHQCHNTHGGHYCSCNNGYALQGTTSCVDINECNSNNGGCGQSCTNQVGSYQCSCTSGYTLDSDKHNCTDIDECSANNDGCGHYCTNTIGGYSCSCQAGFMLNTSDHHTCNDINECSVNNGGCEHGCTNSAGGYSCQCLGGYRLNITDNHTCYDIDECDEGVVDIGGAESQDSIYWCAQRCVNTPGWYRCDCNTGYTLDKSDNQSCSDINECLISNGGCDHSCHNTAGSFYCTCNNGYLLLEDKTGCTDHDECLNDIHGCDHECHNTVGGYYCACYHGYRLNGTTMCVDIDECMEGTSGCDHDCTNTVGSFLCSCQNGYQLSEKDNKTCNDINECDVQNGGCNQLCVNLPGSYYCNCSVGFALGNDNHTCHDVNECIHGNGGCGHTCTNTFGSYKCFCDDGYLLSNDHDCEDIDECKDGIVKVGGLVPISEEGVIEDELWCQQSCVNLNGSYECSCLRGYLLDSDNNQTCSDINECLISNGGCDHSCHNTNGSFYCTCNNGYLLLEDKTGCTDHDECANNVHSCDHICHNTRGGYRCSCISGYRLLNNDKQCIDIDECAELVSGCSDLCHNSIGSFSCSCHDGYYLSVMDNKTCLDINECDSQELNNCSQVCVNDQGSHHCDCIEGYHLAEDMITCLGDPCINMTVPNNATVWCNGPQVTDQYCLITCDPGYNLIGLSNRTCLPNHTWSGDDPFCQPMECPVLEAPPNALVVAPCNREYTSTCMVICEAGYHVTLSAKTIAINYWTQSCVINNQSTYDNVTWTQAMSCDPGNDPCDGNPCYPGVCLVNGADDILCNCQGTYRVGVRCESSIIDIEPIKPLEVDMDGLVTLTAALPVEVTVVASSSNPGNFTINNAHEAVLKMAPNKSPSSVSLTIKSNSPGIYYISYELYSSSGDILKPEDSVVFVHSAGGQSANRSSYFDVLDLTEGTIVPGCCGHHVRQRTLCNTELEFLSSCQWNQVDDVLLTNGVVFVGSKHITLPLSINGLAINNVHSNQSSAYPLLANSGDHHTSSIGCTSCNVSSYYNEQCFTTGSLIPFDTHDVELFLNTNSLTSTFVDRIKPLIPSWLKLTTLPIKGVLSYQLNDFSSSLLRLQDIRNIEECKFGVPQTLSDDSSLFYVLRTRATFHIEIHSFGTFLYAQPNSAHCIIIDICDNPSVHTAVPDKVQPSMLTSFDSFHDLLADNGNLEFKMVTFSKGGIVKRINEDARFWDGIEYFSPAISPFDFEIRSTLKKTFIGGGLEISCDFTGSVLYNSLATGTIPGVLSGRMSLQICHSIIDGNCLKLSSTSSTQAQQGGTDDVISLFAIDCSKDEPDYNNSLLQVFPGMSFKLLYLESTFSNSLWLEPSLISTSSGCIVDGFISVNDDLRVNYISLTSDCLELRINSLQFSSSFRHILHFGGQHSGSSNLSNVSISIVSVLEAHKVNIGNFFEVFADEAGLPNMELVYNLKDMGVSGFIRNVNASIFDSVIHLDSVPLANDQLVFEGTTVIYGICDIRFTGRMPTEHTLDSQQQLPLELEAEIIDGRKKFKTDLNTLLSSHTRSELNLMTTRHKTAELLYKAANEIYVNVSGKYNQVKTEYEDLLVELESVNETVHLLFGLVQDTEQDLVAKYSNINDVINSCTSHNVCQSSCTNSYTCTACPYSFKLETFGVCEKSIYTTRTVTRYRRIERQAWRYETRCFNCWNIVWYLLPYMSIKECCSIVSAPYIELHNEPYPITEQVQHTQYDSCLVEELNITSPNAVQCCERYECAFESLNISCLLNDIMCFKDKQQELNETSVPLMLQSGYEKYTMLKGNLTAAKIALSDIEAQQFVLEQELALIENAMKKASDVVKFRQLAINRLGNLTDPTYSQLIDNTSQLYTDLMSLRIVNISFTTTLSNTTPVVLPIDFVVQYGGVVRSVTIEINFQTSLEVIYRTVAVAIFDDIMNSSGGAQHQARKGVTSIVSLTCVELANLDSFVQQTLHSLIEFQKQLNITTKKIGEMFVNSANISSDIQLVQQHAAHELDSNAIVQRMQVFMGEYGLLDWLKGQALLFANGVVINDYACVGEWDCLLVSVYDLIFIVQDASPAEIKSLEKDLILIKSIIVNGQEFTSLGSVMQNLSKVISTIKELNYWCSDPPSFIEHLPSEMNIIIGEPLKLSCSAHSTLPIKYFWFKDSQILSLTSRDLVIRNVQLSDSGRYHCVAVNDAGNVTSLESLVNVYVKPVLIQSLEPEYETYSGNDNGFHLSCNAQSLPLSGWKWLYRSQLEEDWSIIENSSSNVLRFPVISPEHEGYYTCIAYNVIGNVTSESTYLRILPVEMVQVEYPVTLSLEVHQSQHNVTKRSSVQEHGFDVDALIQKIIEQLDLKSTVKNAIAKSAKFLSSSHQLFFNLALPYSNYSPSYSTQDLVAILKLGVTQLETDKDKMASLLSTDIAIEGSVISVKGYHVDSRHFACPSGYHVSDNQLLCVGCSPGKFGGNLRAQFLDVGNGTVLKQTFAECSDCLVGQYQDKVAQSSCNNCPELYSTLSTGSTSQHSCIGLCKPHTISYNGLFPCTPCPDNYFQLKHGSTQCSECGSMDYSVDRCQGVVENETMPNPNSVGQSQSSIVESFAMPTRTYTTSVSSTPPPVVSGAEKASTDNTLVTAMSFLGVFGVLMVLIVIVIILVVVCIRKQKRLTIITLSAGDGTNVELENIYSKSMEPSPMTDNDLKDAKFDPKEDRLDDEDGVISGPPAVHNALYEELAISPEPPPLYESIDFKEDLNTS